MFHFIQRWLATSPRPIGVDFGTRCLRMAQVQFLEREPRLIAAASVDVPAEVSTDNVARAEFFVSAARDLATSGNFRGNQVILALPASLASIITVDENDPEAIDTAARQAVSDELHVDPDEMLIRHFATQSMTEDSDSGQQIIFAAPRAEVNRLIAAAERAGLQVVGMNIQAKAVIDCFGHIFRRQSDRDCTSCFVDIGESGTRTIAAKGTAILCAGNISIGGADFSRVVSRAMSISMEEARLARLKLCCADAQTDERRDKREVHVVRPSHLSGDIEEQRKIISESSEPMLMELLEQLEAFRQQVEAKFPENHIDRLIFVGGEAQNRSLCRSIARGMKLSATIGDPLLRMGKSCDVGIESGIDRREPQPAWAVAIGLSLGEPNLTDPCRQIDAEKLAERRR